MFRLAKLRKWGEPEVTDQYYPSLLAPRQRNFRFADVTEAGQELALLRLLGCTHPKWSGLFPSTSLRVYAPQLLAQLGGTGGAQRPP